MQLSVAGALRREFAGRSEAAAFRRFQQQQRDERKRRDHEDSVGNDASELLDMAALIVTDVELREFRFQLDRYDAATIEALYENDAALELILRKKEELLFRAYVLPDGRRVFKSEDGIRVFDEHGTQLDASDIDPDLIDESHPSWEVYKPVLDEHTRLIEERRALLDYQAKLDNARERLDAGDMTREEFDRLRGELDETMPDAVRSRIPELAENRQPEPDAVPAVAQTAIDLDISDDMVPTAAASKIMAPGVTG